MYFVMLVYNKLNAPTIKQLYDSQAMLNKLMSLFIESILLNVKRSMLGKRRLLWLTKHKRVWKIIKNIESSIVLFPLFKF